MFAMLLCVVILNCYFCHFNLSRVFCVKFLFLSTFEFLPRKIMKIQSHPLCTLFLLYVICHFAMKFCSSFLCCWFVDVFPPKWFREKLPNRFQFQFQSQSQSHFDPDLFPAFGGEVVSVSNRFLLDFYCIFYAVSHYVACS